MALAFYNVETSCVYKTWLVFVLVMVDIGARGWKRGENSSESRNRKSIENFDE